MKTLIIRTDRLGDFYQTIPYINCLSRSYGKKDIDVEVADGIITVKSIKENSEEDDIVHRGISYRKFEKRFSIADDIQVKGAKLENGLLTIDLERIVPEEKKPRTIAIR